MELYLLAVGLALLSGLTYGQETQRMTDIEENITDKSSSVSPSSSSLSSPKLTMMTTTLNNEGETLKCGSDHKSVVRKYGWVIALIAVAGSGILLIICFEIYILYKLCQTVLIKQWHSLWMGQALLFAIFLCYLTAFAFLPYPSFATCSTIRFCVGVSYGMCFSLLFVKLVVIYAERCGEINSSVPFILFIFVWCVQIAIDVQWMISEKTVVVAADNEDGCSCTPGYKEHVLSLVYIMALMVLCLLLSIGAHGIQINYREGSFIGVCCTLTICIWVVWILLGFLIKKDGWHQPCIAFGLVITATAILITIFAPKIHQLRNLDPDDLLDDEDSFSNYQDSLGSMNFAAVGHDNQKVVGRHFNQISYDDSDVRYYPSNDAQLDDVTFQSNPDALVVEYPAKVNTRKSPTWRSAPRLDNIH